MQGKLPATILPGIREEGCRKNAPLTKKQGGRPPKTITFDAKDAKGGGGYPRKTSHRKVQFVGTEGGVCAVGIGAWGGAAPFLAIRNLFTVCVARVVGCGASCLLLVGWCVMLVACLLVACWLVCGVCCVCVGVLSVARC